MKKFFILFSFVCCISCDNNISRDDYAKTFDETYSRIEKFIVDNKETIDEGIKLYEETDSTVRVIYGVAKDEFIPKLDSLFKNLKNN